MMMDGDVWKEVYKLLDLPLSGLIAFTSYFFIRAWHVPSRWRAAVPFCGGIIVAIIVPSPFAFTPHNVLRRILIYAGGAAFLHELLGPKIKTILGPDATEETDP